MPKFRAREVPEKEDLSAYFEILKKAEVGVTYEAILEEEETSREVRRKLRQAARALGKQVRFPPYPPSPAGVILFQVYFETSIT